MKMAQMNRITYLRVLTVAIGFVLMSVNQAQSLDSMIAFSSDRDNPGGNHDIFVMKPNGSQVRNLSNNPLSHDQAPAWSPDRTRIAFEARRDEKNSEIYVMTADGKNLVRLTLNRWFSSDPSWSPDGRKIAFESERVGNWEIGKIRKLEIYVMAPDGNNHVRLTNNSGVDRDPSWSPDGRKIAFTSGRRGRANPQIHVMASNGNGPARLTRSPKADSSPSWSPNGRKIAFSSKRDGNGEIYVINANGKNLVRLTRHPEDDHSPGWSPDGRKIAFASVRDGNWEIYVMNADGGNPTNLTKHPADDVSPAWPPNPLAVSPKTQLLMLWATIKNSH